MRINYDLQLSNGFVGMKPTAQATKKNINNLDFIKMENFCASKDTTKKEKREKLYNGKSAYKLYVWKRPSIQDK